MRKFSSDIIYPVSQDPIENGILITDHEGIIKEVIDPSEIDYLIDEVEKSEGVICPGFVNAHCHLELSFLKNKITQGQGLDNFVREIENKRNESKEIIEESIVYADKEMYENGIVAVGDICNDEFTFNIKSKSKIYYHNFIEVFSFDPVKAERAFVRGKILQEKLTAIDHELNFSITPHAPYSCSKELFIKLVENSKNENKFLTIHNQENEEENLFFLSKKGKLVDRLKSFGVNLDNWQPPGKRSLLYLIDLIDDEIKFLFVHNTVTNSEDIDYALNKNKKLWWCFCPGANLYIENKLPDVKMFYEKVNNRLTIGTDSLASNNQLSILEEMKLLHDNFNFISLNDLLKWATLHGARFLETENIFGSFEKNKKPGINLIYNLDLENNKLTKDTRVKKLL